MASTDFVENSKQAILKKIAEKISSKSEVELKAAIRHQAHGSSKTSHGNSYRSNH